MKDSSSVFIEKRRFPSPHPAIDLYEVTYLSTKLRVKGLLAEPKEAGEYEGFLYLRGGINNVGAVRPARITQFASEGFIVFAPYYRGNIGGEGYEDFCGEDRWDAIEGFHLLEEHPRVDSTRIHIFGFSRGGMMALWTGLTCPSAASLVTWGGVSDMVLTYEERIDLRRMMKRVIGGTPNRFPERYQSRTPLDHLNELTVPVLIIHGEHDGNVSIEHAYKLEQKLKGARKKVETWYFSEYTHFFPPAVNSRIVADLTRWMKSQ